MHYVESKDEIFAWLLQKRLEKTNIRFMDEVKQGSKTSIVKCLCIYLVEKMSLRLS